MALESVKKWGKFLTLLPRLLVLGFRKVTDRPGEVAMQGARDTKKLPKIAFLATRASYRKFVRKARARERVREMREKSGDSFRR